MSNDLTVLHYQPQPRWRFGLGDRIGLETHTSFAVYLRFVETLGVQHHFENVADKIHEILTDDQITEYSQTPGWKYDPGWFTRRATEARLLAGVDHLALLPDPDKAEMIRRMTWISAILKFAEDCRLPLTDKLLQRLIDDKKDEIVAIIRKEIGKLRVGKKVQCEAVPHRRTLWRWLALFEASGRQAESLRPGYFRRPQSEPWEWSPEVEALIRKHLGIYTSEARPTQAEAYLAFEADVDALNELRVEADEDELDYPSLATFKRRIRAQGSFTVYAGRQGMDAAMKKFPYVSMGLDVTVPGQRIEIDCWKIDLQALLIQAQFWATLTEDLRKQVARQRFQLCMAIDAASRAVLAMQIGISECAELAVRTLHMVTRDKQPFADAVGALSPWHMACRPLEIAADMGAGFISEDFRAAVVALKAHEVNPPAGQAQMRARIERIFGTLSKRALAFFTGRTFSNPQELGNYPAEARATITVEELCWILIRFVVDIYHNTPHEGLRLKTPFNSWHKLIQEHGQRLLPDSHEQRNIFGKRFKRAVGPQGVRFYNNFYQSPDLHEYIKQHGSGKMIEIIVDLENLGAITAKIGANRYVTVPCISEELHGVSFDIWSATCDALYAQHGEEAKIALPAVLQTLREFMALSERAVKRANIGPTTLTPEQIDAAERRLMIPWESEQQGKANPDPDADIFGDGNIIPPAPEPDEPAPDTTDAKDDHDGEAYGDEIDPRDDEWTVHEADDEDTEGDDE